MQVWITGCLPGARFTRRSQCAHPRETHPPYGRVGAPLRSCAPGSFSAATPHGVTGALGAQERAILRELAEHSGRVLSRQELARRCGLSELHERRCDSLLVRIRQVIGADALVTVRRRGWMLRPEYSDAAAAILAEDELAS